MDPSTQPESISNISSNPALETPFNVTGSTDAISASSDNNTQYAYAFLEISRRYHDIYQAIVVSIKVISFAKFLVTMILTFLALVTFSASIPYFETRLVA